MFFCGYNNSSSLSSPYYAASSVLTLTGFTGGSATSSLPSLDRAQLSDGTIRSITIDFTTTSNLLIYFGSWIDPSWSRTIDWYSFKIWNNQTLLANFVPCYKLSDNSIGFYDTISNRFYSNNGTGTFLKG